MTPPQFYNHSGLTKCSGQYDGFRSRIGGGVVPDLDDDEQSAS